MTICYQCRVTGVVQGVFFRATTQQKAERLGVRGYARNMPDGSVDVLACGEEAAVQALCDWLWQGPDYAKVEDVKCEQVAVDPVEEFSTR